MSLNESDEPLLRVDGLMQYFKLGKGELRAVDGVSFEIKRGEVFGLVGESGCGKTTTGRSIIGLYKITGGDIYFDGEKISSGTLPYRRMIDEAKKDYKAALADADDATRAELKGKMRTFIAECKGKISEAYITNRKRQRKSARSLFDMQMVFQDPMASLNPRMTVGEIISEGLVIRGVRDKAEIQRRVYEMLELVGLVREHAGRYPHEFSGGQRQRIGIARAIIMNPKLIIADEPVSALDVSVQAQVINLFNELRERFGLTVLFIAHDLSVVKYFSDRIAVMYKGKIVELAQSDELFSHPLHPYTRSLLSAIPLPDPIYERKRQRIAYIPDEHDYSIFRPSMREITEGHFVFCNDLEERKYRESLL